MEVNANPSLNVYIDKELPNGDIEQTLSELDKYVKTMLLSDTFKWITDYKDQMADEVGCLKRILPVDSRQLDLFHIYSDAERIFEKLTGPKNFDFITST